MPSFIMHKTRHAYRQKMSNTQHLSLESPPRQIAYRLRRGSSPTIVFIHGLGSDMLGTKAETIDSFCGENQRQYLRFDLSAHGASDGTLQTTVLSQWLADIDAMLNHVGDDAYILVGSSLGAWLAFLTAQRRKDIVGMIAIAAAIDASHRLLLASLSPQQRQSLQNNQTITFASGDFNYTLSPAFFKDAEPYLLLKGKNPRVAAPYPTHFLHGGQDDTVPYTLALEMMQALSGGHPSVFTLIKDGDHRLSDPFSLDCLTDCLRRFCNNHDTAR